MKKAILPVIFLLMVGCSAATIQEMKEKGAYHRQVVINENIQDAFKRTKDMIDQEISGAKSILYKDHGEIAVQPPSGGYNFYAEILPISEQQTSIDFYGFTNVWTSKINEWADRLESAP